MARIVAIDEILVDATPDAAWRLLADLDGYDRWWPRIVRVRVTERRPELVGSELEIHPRGGFPFRCRVESVEAPTTMRMRYEGPYSGDGIWRVTPTATGASIVYRIDLRTRRLLLGFLGRFVDLGRVHSRAMRRVLRGMERALQSQAARETTGASV